MSNVLSSSFSESSLFVAKDRIVLKTCGKTKVLNCVEPLLKLAKEYIGVAVIQVLFLLSVWGWVGLLDLVKTAIPNQLSGWRKKLLEALIYWQQSMVCMEI